MTSRDLRWYAINRQPVEARFYEKRDGRCDCVLCPHFCKLKPAALGRCGVRRNVDGVLIAESYGRLTSVAIDPIEKKPLYMFDRGVILSIGSYGCNFRCDFCQNHQISFGGPETCQIYDLPAFGVCELALRHRSEGNIGVAYTYNEPFISYEYVQDCASLVHENGLKNVLVTNGFVNPEPLIELLPLVDALNIDLKSFSPEFYREIGGDIEAVKNTIATAAKHAHVEVTTLIIPRRNDSPEEISALAEWLAGIDPEIPLHLTRFRPMHRLTDREATATSVTAPLAAAAKRYLRHVFAL